MEVSISRFRRDLFSLVEQAFSGQEVWVSHKGKRFKIAPDGGSVDKLSRITPMEVINPGCLSDWEETMKREMLDEMEHDWSQL